MRALLSLGTLMLAPAVFTQGVDLGAEADHLRFFHTHTGERLDVVYRIGDRYIPEALDKLITFCAITAPAIFTITIPGCLICLMI